MIKQMTCVLLMAAVSVTGMSVDAAVAAVPPFVSHRGESVDAPENTLAAYRLAAARGVNGIECDVYTSSDGVPICLHDDTFARTCGVDKRPSEMTWAEISQLSAVQFGSWATSAYANEKIPSLAQFLEVVAANNIFAFIELKSGTGLVDATVAAVRATPGLDLAKVQFISFTPAHISAVRAALPQCKAHLLLSSFSGVAALKTALAQCQASGVDMVYTAGHSAADVAAVKAAGYEFHVWTIDDVASAAEQALMGVDSITTDRGLYLRNNIAAAITAAESTAAARAELTDPTRSARPTVVIAPGNNVATNVAQRISGDVNVQINDTDVNGGLVTLAALNDYLGRTYVKSGTLAVADVGGVLEPSAIGAAAAQANAVLIGNGTFRFTGTRGVTDRDFVFVPNASRANFPGVVCVDDGGELRLEGAVTGFGNGGASLLKTGDGTLTIATRRAGTLNYFARNSSSHNSRLALPANGDSPSAGVSCLGVTAGRLVLDGAFGVTHKFANESLVGVYAPTPRGAHLDINGGVNIFENWIAIARCTGDATTDSEAGACTVNINGGETVCQNLGFGYCLNNGDTFRPLAIVNVRGGSLQSTANVRIDHTRSRGILNISAGTYRTVNHLIANLNAGSHFTVNLSGGTFQNTGTIDTSVQGSSVVRFNLTGGNFIAGTIKNSKSTDCEMLFDGVALTMNGDWAATKVVTGARASSLALSGTRTLAAPLVGGANDGGIDITANQQGFVLNLNGAVGATLRPAHGAYVGFSGNTVTAPVILADGAGIRASAATTLPDVRMDAAGLARLVFANASAKLTFRSWTAPGTLTVKLETVPADGTYDLVTFPATTSFAAASAIVADPVSGKSYAFAVREDGATRTLMLTVGASGGASETDPVAYTTRLYPFSSFASSTVRGPITVNGTRSLYMGVDVPAGEELVFAGGLNETSGGFAKLGAGTLRLAGPYDYVFARTFGKTTSLADANSPIIRFDAGNASLFAYAAFEVCGGTLVFGEPGQSFQVLCDELWVGSGYQTNGVAPDAEMIQNGGSAAVSATYLVVGRNPGYAKGDVSTLGGRPWINSTYTLNGGSLDVKSLIVGYNSGAGARQHSTFEMFGGRFRQLSDEADKCRIGNIYMNGADSLASFVMHGGTAEIASKVTIPHNNCPSVISLSDGAVLELKNGIQFNGHANHTLAITNATLAFGTSLNGNAKGTLILDGATLRPGANTVDDNIQNFGSFKLGAGGVTIDTTDMTYGWVNMYYPLVGGPLTVRGDDNDHPVCLRNDGSTCPITLEAGGAVSLCDNSGSGCSIVAHHDSAIWNTGYGIITNRIASLVLGDDEDSITYLRGTQFDANMKSGFATDALVVHGKVRVAYRQSGTAVLATDLSGRAQVITAPRGSIDPAQFELDPRVVAVGMMGAFTLVQNGDGTDTLYVDVTSAASHVHAWGVNGDGAWSVAANWQNGAAPENVAGDPVSFPAAVTQRATIDLGGATRTVGRITGASAADVTITGGKLLLDNSTTSPSVSYTGGGTLTLPELAFGYDPWSGGVTFGGRVRLDGDASSAKKITLANGSVLSGAPQNLGTVPLTLNNGWLKPTSSGTYSSPVTVNGSALFMDVPEGVNASLANVNNSKSFVKIGKGTLSLVGTGSFFLGNASIGDINAGNFTFPTDGTTPSAGCAAGNIFGGRVVLGREGQSISCNGNEFWVGGHPVLDANGDPQDAQLDICGGSFSVGNYFGVGRTRSDAPTNNGRLTRRPNYTVNIYDGNVTVTHFLINYCTDYKQCAKSVLNMYGGTFTCASGRFAIGHHWSRTTINGEKNEAIFNQYGGTVHVNGEMVWVSGYAGAGGAGELNLFGGTFDAGNKEVSSRPLNADCDYGIIRLAGGTLRTKRLYKNSGNGTSTLVLNGGAFIPTSDAALSGFNSCYASTNATAIDVSEVASHTLDQTVEHDANLGDAADGGLVKRGYGRLLVKQALNFTGPFGVYGGVVDLNGSALFSLRALAGCGTVSNGTVLVESSVEPKSDPSAAAPDYPVSLTVAALKFDVGAIWKVGVVDAEANLAARLNVAGAMTANGPVTVDFGRTEEDPLPTTFDARIGSVGTTTDLPRFTCAHTGLGDGYRASVVVKNGHDLYARVAASGTVILLR